MAPQTIEKPPNFRKTGFSHQTKSMRYDDDFGFVSNLPLY